MESYGKGKNLYLYASSLPCLFIKQLYYPFLSYLATSSKAVVQMQRMFWGDGALIVRS